MGRRSSKRSRGRTNQQRRYALALIHINPSAVVSRADRIWLEAQGYLNGTHVTEGGLLFLEGGL